MNNKSYFSTLFKRFFWAFMDYILRVILISVLWFVFNLPLFWLLLTFIYSGVVNFYTYFALFIIIFFSPISFGGSYYILQIASQYFSSEKFELFNKYPSASYIKLSIFFKGITRYFFKSLLSIIINLIISLFFYINVTFYWRVLVPKVPLIGLFLTGVVFWGSIIYLLMLNYLIPLLITKQINVFKALYQSFLLVIDNVFYTIGACIFLSSFLVIMIFTIAGFAVVFYGMFSLFQIFSMLIIYQKYDETLVHRDEKRTLRNLIKPWD